MLGYGISQRCCRLTTIADGGLVASERGPMSAKASLCRQARAVPKHRTRQCS